MSTVRGMVLRTVILLALVGCTQRDAPQADDVPSEDTLGEALASGSRVPEPAPTAWLRGELQRTFDEIDAAGFLEHAWWSTSPNNDGVLAWRTSGVLLASLTMYRATGEVRYLERFTSVADNILAQRDIVRGQIDYRGESNPCWQATKYSRDMEEGSDELKPELKPIDQRSPYCWAIHTALIGYPLAEFALAVREHQELVDRPAPDGETLGQKAEAYLFAAEAGLTVHDEQWVEEGDEIGYYMYRRDALDFLPNVTSHVALNMDSALGMLSAALADATGLARYRDRTRRLGNYVLRNLSPTSDGGYTWQAVDAQSTPQEKNWTEDVSHGGLTVRFAARAAKSEIVFTGQHLDRLADTFVNHIYVDSKTSGPTSLK